MAEKTPIPIGKIIRRSARTCAYRYFGRNVEKGNNDRNSARYFWGNIDRNPARCIDRYHLRTCARVLDNTKAITGSCFSPYPVLRICEIIKLDPNTRLILKIIIDYRSIWNKNRCFENSIELIENMFFCLPYRFFGIDKMRFTSISQ